MCVRNTVNISMKKEEIDILLKRYYEGSGTEEDEKTLKEFFNGDSIPAGYEAEKDIFRYFVHSSRMPAPSDDFEERIISSLSRLPRRKPSINRIIIAISGIAAGLLIIIGSWFLISDKGNRDTYSDPQIAYAETLRILYGVSEKLNQGTSALEPVSKMNLNEINSLDILSESTETIEKNLTNLEYLNKIIEMTNISGQENKSNEP